MGARGKKWFFSLHEFIFNSFIVATICFVVRVRERFRPLFFLEVRVTTGILLFVCVNNKEGVRVR